MDRKPLASAHHRRGRWVVAASAVMLAAGLFFPRAGRFLVSHDVFTHAETALVLSGDPVHRTLAARDLYQQGLVERVLLIPEPPDPARGELVRLGLEDPELPQMSERILVASGIPRSKITFLPEPINGTIVEAERVQAFLRGRPPRSLVVITSRSASRRACAVFRRIFRKDAIPILCSPTPYDSFIEERWWSQPRNALCVVTEYQKLIANMAQLTLRGS